MIEQAKMQAVGAPDGRVVGLVRARAKELGDRLAQTFAACADAWEAAALYQNLSRLSDAELERRGIPRGEISRRVFEALAGPQARL